VGKDAIRPCTAIEAHKCGQWILWRLPSTEFSLNH
jgi:hypothetical protein